MTLSRVLVIKHFFIVGIERVLPFEKNCFTCLMIKTDEISTDSHTSIFTYFGLLCLKISCARLFYPKMFTFAKRINKYLPFIFFNPVILHCF